MTPQPTVWPAFRWSEGGAVMLGSSGGPADGVHDEMKPGASAAYVVS